MKYNAGLVTPAGIPGVRIAHVDCTAGENINRYWYLILNIRTFKNRIKTRMIWKTREKIKY
jgi:hypothetical protein